jgi:hypothetical protein
MKTQTSGLFLIILLSLSSCATAPDDSWKEKDEKVYCGHIINDEEYSKCMTRFLDSLKASELPPAFKSPTYYDNKKTVEEPTSSD